MTAQLDAAIRYAELDYRVFPCAPGRKLPLTEHGFQDATSDIDQIESWWRSRPNANVAIATERLLVVDVDSKENPWLGNLGEKASDLAAAPLAITGNGGRHYIFRQPPDRHWRNTTGKLGLKVDTRADGGYIVAPPSVLTGDRRYRWAQGMELDDAADQLPEPPDWLTVLLDKLAASANGSPRVASSAPVGNTIPSGQRNSTLASLAGTMRRVGMSQSEILAALVQANADRCSPPLSHAEIERIAASVARYQPDQISVALAEDHWSQLAGDDDKPTTNEPADPGPLPERLLRVPGFISEVIDFNLTTAQRRQPALALAGAISLQAVLAARRVRDERGNRTNLYVVSVAPSGAGKDHARKVCRQTLYESGLEYLEANDEIASDAGLISAAEAEPACLFQIDEFGRFLRTIGDPKRAPHLYNALGAFMKLYSSADTMFRGKAYGDRKRNKTIDQPCVCLHGTSVPDHFYESLTADSMNDGFVARLLVFEALDTPARQRVSQQAIPVPIVQAAQWWGDFEPGGNLRQEHPTPEVVPMTAKAGAMFDDFAELVDSQLQVATNAASLWARAEEKACRLALVYACSASREKPVIDASAARWACDLSEHLTRRVLYLANQWVAEGHFDARQKKVLRVIRESGGEIGRRDLSRRTQWLSHRERADIIQNLVETGQIEARTEPTSTKPRMIYTLR